jgi:hypothetical protein
MKKPMLLADLFPGFRILPGTEDNVQSTEIEIPSEDIIDGMYSRIMEMDAEIQTLKLQIVVLLQNVRGNQH